uniref:Uncharacterized protein n=1 Tax=Cucumis melo TaxID=3656 RepID=A0A9I9E7X3_CUCME
DSSRVQRLSSLSSANSFVVSSVCPLRSSSLLSVAVVPSSFPSGHSFVVPFVCTLCSSSLASHRSSQAATQEKLRLFAAIHKPPPSFLPFSVQSAAINSNGARGLDRFNARA